MKHIPILSGKKVVRYFPVACAVLLVGAPITQIARMVQEQSSRDQSLLGWILVGFALMLWLNWYRVFVPGEKLPFWSTALGLVVNLIGTGVVVWFRL